MHKIARLKKHWQDVKDGVFPNETDKETTVIEIKYAIAYKGETF